MARETLVRAYDDQERKRNKDSKAEATRRVEIEVKVFDIDDNYLPNESLERRTVDLMAANLDTVKGGASKAWDAGARVAGGAPTSGRRSGSKASGSGGGRSSGTISNSQATQKQAFNKAIREWAATQKKWAETNPQGRLPGALIEDFKAQNQDWAQTYFKGNPPEDQKASTAPATPVDQASNVEPAPEPAFEDTPSFDNDPPLADTHDDEWSRTPAGFSS
jgi:hypothetical protein